MTGPLINPTGDPSLHEIEDAQQWHRAMHRRMQKTGKPPTVEVVIQVRGAVVPVEVYRERLARAIGHMKRRQIPVDERGPLLERAMQETDSRAWEDTEIWWSGPYDPEDVEFPTAAKLEKTKQKFGADEARAVIRAHI